MLGYWIKSVSHRRSPHYRSGEGCGEGQPQYVLASELEEGGGLPLHPHQALVAHVAGGSHRAHPDLTVAHPEQDAHLSFSLQILRNAFLHYLRDKTVILPLPSQLCEHI